jgi:hypothetical protein
MLISSVSDGIGRDRILLHDMLLGPLGSLGIGYTILENQMPRSKHHAIL